MSPYRRAKRGGATKPSKTTMSISLGSVCDEFEALKAKCNDKAIELLDSIDLTQGEILEVVFWTADCPELIGVATFTKNDAGYTTFSIDYDSLTTL